MTNQELAESMAEFLGWDTSGENRYQSFQEWFEDENDGRWEDEMDMEEIIFSPTGFFAVWDKLGACESKVVQLSIIEGGATPGVAATLEAYPRPLPEPRNSADWIWFADDCPDRYTAFYSAVHEMKGTK